MKLVLPRGRKATAGFRLTISLATIALLPLFLYGSAPSWWSQRGVLVENAQPDDYAPANQGQLKNIAKAAAAEMDARLSGGAGDELHALITSWSVPGAVTNDFAPVNLGQLKAVAKPFYDRLIAVGLTDFYPWLSSSNPADDFAVANIGQVKNVFSFQIPTSNSLTDPLQHRLAAGQRIGNLALEANAVWFWGNRFVPDSNFQSTYPRRLTDLPDIESVSAGDNHLVALANNGTVFTWGKNNSGQLGDGTNMDRNAPAVLPNLANIISVQAGGAHTLALQQDGTVLAWGDNYYGQLGTGDNTPSLTPILVAGLTGVRKIAAGPQRSVALKEDGTVWTWGYDHYAWQTGEDISNNIPSQVADLNGVVDIAGGYEHVVVVRADGTVWAWGSNYSNQIGNGNQWWQFQDVPTQVPNLTNVVKVAAGFDHTLALLSDGTVWAWGVNNFGQLGDGTTQPRQSPVQVTGLADVIAIAASWPYSLAMKSDGTVWTWGDGSSGTLPNVDLHVPQQVGLGLFDTEHDGMDDRWEMEYLGTLDSPADADLDGDGISNLHEFLRGTNPRDYFNGTIAVIEMVSGNNQLGDPGSLLPRPIKVRIKNAAGQLLTNAPVVFRVPSGNGLVTARPGEALVDDLVVRSDAIGEAMAYVLLPQIPGISTRITAAPSVPDLSTSPPVAFRVSTRFVLPPTPTPTPDPNASATPTPSPTATPRAPYRYAIVDLGKGLYPIRINHRGWVLLAGSDANGSWGYYRWRAGTLERLNYSGPLNNFIVTDINDEGTVVGWAGDASGNRYSWVYGGKNEFQVGLKWPVNSPEPVTISGLPHDERGDSGRGPMQMAYLTAISNPNPVTNAVDIYGGAYTGGGYIWSGLFDALNIMNAQRWSGDSGPAALSFATSTMYRPPGFAFTVPLWEGPIDQVLRANTSRNCIGRQRTPNPPPLLGGNESGMVNGQAVAFDPVDLNEAGIVVGSAGADMIVNSSQGPQITISSASPLAINDHTRLAPSPQPFPATSPLPTPIPAPQILAWAGNALVIWERQDDGQTWHPFGLEEMIPSMDGWEYLEPNDINDTGTIVGRAWYTDRSIPGAQGESHGFMLVPVELMVDGNRDGEMSFDDPAVHEADQTSEEKPYRFWVNDDDDGILDGEEIEGGSPDYSDIYLKSMRDLEDVARLWITFKGMTEAIKSGDVTVQLEWKSMDGGTSWPSDAGDPAINVFKAVETDGSNKYLSDEAVAKSQVSYGNTPGEYSISLGRVGRGRPLVLPTSLFATLIETAPNKFFLFEGAGAGKGQLVLTLRKGGQEIGEYPPLYLDLKNVRQMYERGKITLDASEIPDPWDNDNPPPLMWVWDPWNWPPDIDPNVKDKTIAYVHGWRMTYGEYLLWADATFKRLWHLGFKGRFYSFRWPTYHGDNNGPNPADMYKSGGTTYNPSEYRAWLSGPALANFVNSLPGSQKYIIAHSMGNVAAGSALRAGMQITRYAMCNAAVAAMAFDQNIVDFNYETPDTDSDQATRSTFGLANKLNPSGTKLVNFSLPADFALGQWNVNNEFFKPQPRLTANYYYRPLNSPGRKLTYEGLVTIRVVKSEAEAIGYATQSRSAAEGTKQSVSGSINAVVNMGSGGFDFGTEHSAEWEF